MDILVTGGAGFIGGHLAERIVRDGHDVTVLDNFDPFYALEIKEHTVERCRSLAEGGEGGDGVDGDADGAGEGTYTLVEGDVRDEATVAEVVGPADVVFHQAAQAGVRQSVADPRRYDAVNVDGTLNVLDAARDSDTRRVVLASSSSVYGVSEDLPYNESDPTLPRSPYGASKLAAERYGCAYSAVYDLPVVALRYFTVYGPRMRPNMAMTNFVSRCRQGEPPVVYGDGTQTRDFTYIDDVVAANVALLEDDGLDGRVANIGSTDRIEILALAREIRDQLAPALDIEFAERHAADAEHTHADITRAAETIGYEPTYTIREGVSAFIDWYEANASWYDPLVRRS